MISAQYAYLKDEPGPAILREFLNIYGTTETPGHADSPLILNWAKECGVGNIYTHDAMPWCALAMTLCAKRAGLPHPKSYAALRAASFATWGTPQKLAMLGDVLVLERRGGAHVGLYVGEDETHFHVLGGNQLDSVCIMRLEKSRIVAIRRTPGETPDNVRVIILSPKGKVSTNEA